jgi:DNA-binding LytR/AlgR family response regulator
MKLRCLIIDDEPLAINVIKNYLKEFDAFEVIGTCKNAIEAFNHLKEKKIDVIFLDINMPILDGISFLKTLDIKPLVVITSAHEEFAVESFELDVTDYLVKPIPFPRFVKAIDKVLRNVAEQQQKKTKPAERPSIFVKIDKKKLKKIYLDEILVVESLKDYLKITTLSDKHIIHQTLSNFTEKLPSSNFIRIHRSYTIAIDKITSIEGNSVEIAGIRYIIGRTYLDSVKEIILKQPGS